MNVSANVDVVVLHTVWMSLLM